jgi:hypothetical protein
MAHALSTMAPSVGICYCRRHYELCSSCTCAQGLILCAHLRGLVVDICRCRCRLLSQSHVAIGKCHALGHEASSSTFVVVIAVVVVVAVAQCDVNASGAHSEDLVIDVCCCRCRN